MKVVNVALGAIYHTGSLRQTLRRLVVSECGLRSPADILMCDAVHKQCDQENISQDKKWLKLTEADFSNNHMHQFGEYLQDPILMLHYFPNGH